MHYQRIAQLKTFEAFRAYLGTLGLDLPADATLETGADAPLARSFAFGGRAVGNRFAVLPMEGWDGTTDGMPTDLTLRRWERFGMSGAKLIWGGEAVAVRPDGRANPNQLIISPQTLPGLVALRERLIGAHRAGFGRVDDLYIGLQLTFSGRFSRPVDKKRLDSQIVYHHPFLDARYKLPATATPMTDDQIRDLIGDFVRAAVLAQQAGYDFVDLKHCHGYFGHELLSAVDRPGDFGGSFENRTRFLREMVAGIRQAAPGLTMAVRLSAFDFIPFKPGTDEERTGQPEPLPTSDSANGYPYAFGGDGTGTGIDLTEPRRFLDLLRELGIRWVCLTAGSPYYNPHIQRPALFPPSDGYQPPEDPLVGVARQIRITRELKRSHPDLIVVGSAYSYLQEWLPNVAQAVIREGGADFVGLGRMMLAYPELPADVLAGRPLNRKLLCRTFSDCTTAPRNNLPSGCYPLDTFYKERDEARELAALKK